MFLVDYYLHYFISTFNIIVTTTTTILECHFYSLYYVSVLYRVAGGLDFGLLSAEIEWEKLVNDVTRFEEDGNAKYTSLVAPGGGDPDDAFSGVPYEKVSEGKIMTM